jgi:imidazolonepropionase-like amidohydrolase
MRIKHAHQEFAEWAQDFMRQPSTAEEWQDTYSALDVELGLMVKRAGMTAADAIRSATLIGARTIGRDKDMGTIEVGKLANLVVLDKDPLKDISSIRSVYITIKNGIRYPRSKYTAVTPEQVKSD